MAELDIPWHAGTPHGPSNHLLDSQVQCVNALFPMVSDPDRIPGGVRRNVLDIGEVLPIEPGRFLTFEYIGPVDYFNEGNGKPRQRGAPGAPALTPPSGTGPEVRSNSPCSSGSTPSRTRSHRQPEPKADATRSRRYRAFYEAELGTATWRPARVPGDARRTVLPTDAPTTRRPPVGDAPRRGRRNRPGPPRPVAEQHRPTSCSLVRARTPGPWRYRRCKCGISSCANLIASSAWTPASSSTRRSPVPSTSIATGQQRAGWLVGEAAGHSALDRGAAVSTPEEGRCSRSWAGRRPAPVSDSTATIGNLARQRPLIRLARGASRVDRIRVEMVVGRWKSMRARGEHSRIRARAAEPGPSLSTEPPRAGVADKREHGGGATPHRLRSGGQTGDAEDAGGDAGVDVGDFGDAGHGCFDVS